MLVYRSTNTWYLVLYVRSSILCIYKGASPGGRARAAVEANARKKREITAKGSLRYYGLLTNIPINSERLEKLILTTDCVYIINSGRDLNHDYGNA